jgi:hypothetical protein
MGRAPILISINRDEVIPRQSAGAKTTAFVRVVVA